MTDAPAQESSGDDALEPMSPEEASEALRAQGAGEGAGPGGSSTTDAPTLIGRDLGQYRVLEKLGQGGMGAVFRAHDLKLDRTVALKVLYCGPLDDRKTAERFQREAISLARLQHPNLLHVYNVGSEGDLHYFAMELLEGITLSELIRRRRGLPAEEFLPLAGQLLSALHYVHRQGITHRDIKSGNIMVCGNRAVLMDFGLAKDESFTGLTSVGVVLGTPEFMSPEQAEGQSAGPPTDLYSFGVVMYEALAGEVPFRGRSAMSIIRQHMDEPPPDLTARVPGANARLAGIIQRCMAKLPEDRYADCCSLAAELLSVAATPELRALASHDGSAETMVRRNPPAPFGAPNDPFTPTVLARSGETIADGDEGDGLLALAQDETPARPPWVWAAAGFGGMLLVGLLLWVVLRKKPQVETPPAGPAALPVADLKDAEGRTYDLLEFTSASDPSQWRYVLRVHEADGKTRREEVVGQENFEKLRAH
ncbi:MAG: serine/threonine protein kinase [Planctomycetes bacterium]|nr:serine/threonine protein kinase [Planctomycetota bacterium]